AQGALVQALVVGVPAVTLLLRLQALLASQGLAGSAPEGWAAFMGALTWAGGLTALVAAAGTMVAVGTLQWTALITAHTLGMAVWALGLDTPTGRLAALAILLSFGMARLTLELAMSPAGEGARRGARSMGLMP